MCGRFILIQKLKKLEQRFEVQAPPELDFTPSYNIAPGKKSLVITSEKPDSLQAYRFGMTPFWAKKAMLLINARAEGDRNKENDPAYRGSRDIIRKPSFRKPIRSQRCLVLADAFYEGSEKEKLDDPYVVYLRDKIRPFAFAGLYDTWLDKSTGEEISGFSIITTVANDLLLKIPHPRSPVILTPSQEKKWLKADTPLTDITAMLRPYSADKMNAYPVSTEVKNPRNDGKQLLEARGKPLVKEEDIGVEEKLKRQGFGRNKRHF